MILHGKINQNNQIIFSENRSLLYESLNRISTKNRRIHVRLTYQGRKETSHLELDQSLHFLSLLCTRKRRFHSSKKKRISLWVAFSRRQFFAPLNRDDLQDLLSSSVSLSLSVAALKSHLCASYEPTPLFFCLYSTFVYTFMVAP